MTSGIRTSEFWITLAPWILALGVIALVAAGRIDGDTAMILLGLFGIGGGISNHGYSQSRAKVKAIDSLERAKE